MFGLPLPLRWHTEKRNNLQKAFLAASPAVSGFGWGYLRGTEPHQPSWSLYPFALPCSCRPFPTLGGRGQVLEASPTCQQFCFPHFYCLHVVWQQTRVWDWAREKSELGGAPVSSPSSSGYLWVIQEWQEWIRKDQTKCYRLCPWLHQSSPAGSLTKGTAFVHKRDLDFSPVDTSSTRQEGVGGISAKRGTSRR